MADFPENQLKKPRLSRARASGRHVAACLLKLGLFRMLSGHRVRLGSSRSALASSCEPLQVHHSHGHRLVMSPAYSLAPKNT